MGTKYTSVSVSGYSANAPADDGSQTEANKIKYDTLKQKLADPIKDALDTINSRVSTALDQSCRAVTANDSAAASDHDKTIQVTTAGVTITLADAATMAAGYVVNVANQSGGDITVALATSTDTIDTVTNTTHTLVAKEMRRYVVNASANGYVSNSAHVTATGTQTLTNKTLTSPVLNTGVSGTAVADQTAMEAGSSTSTIVTPGRQHLHPSAAKAWVMCDSAGAAQVSHNVSSITDSGTGNIEVVWDTDFSSGNYATVATTGGNTTTPLVVHRNVSGGVSSTSANFRTFSGASATDATNCFVAAFGDQS